MKVTTRGRYAVRAMVALAVASTGEPVPLKAIATEERIPEQYLQQVFVRLRRKGLVRSVRGVGGGFILGKEADEIAIGEIVRTAEGERRSVGCHKDGRRCAKIGACKTQKMWETLEDKMDAFLDGVTVADLFAEAGIAEGDAEA